MDIEGIVLSEISQTEKRQILYDFTYAWNLEEWYWRTYLHGSSSDADTEHGLVHTVGEGEGGTNCENSVETYIQLSSVQFSRSVVSDSL